MASRANKTAGKRKSTGKVSVTIEVERTIKAGSAAHINHPKDLNTQEKQLIAYNMSLEFVAQSDIARALGVSQSYVSQLIDKQSELQKKKLEDAADKWRSIEVDRIDRFVLHWYKRARYDVKASETLRGWLERRDKLLGLYVNRTELSGPNGRPITITASALDITKLDDEELMWLERIVSKAAPDVHAAASGTSASTSGALLQDSVVSNQ